MPKNVHFAVSGISRSRSLVPSIEVNNVDFSFGQGESAKQVLFDNQLAVYPGEIVIMTGPSGSGKTTLLTLIGALRGLQSGSLKVMGQELSGMHAQDQQKLRMNIGFIFQMHNLFDSLTAYQTVRLAMELHDYTDAERRELPIALLNELELGHRVTYKPQKLSGGQKQRVAIARALVNHPKLILADEPTAALDKETSRLVVNVLRRRATEENATILIVTHDNRILDVANRIVNMVDGYIVSNVSVADSLAICNFLRLCPIFADISPGILADLAKEVLVENFKAGDIVFKAGDVGDKFYLVYNGRAEVVSGTDSTILAVIEKGGFFGELALLQDTPRAASVRVTADSELLVLQKDRFLEVTAKVTSLEKQLRDFWFK